ncbi:LacI family DNA-binding transcriptional regulator [Jannaschia donghaensis]|uniref:LacI family DNA-binding transcriptional regulator n=1 Tax=Jannaschia donghaensis TaxID=420998 RepID=UPI00165172DD|nr:LacI family DNA-binding transcriptional regulator [Jannaschia donghaensis]
MPRSRPDTPVTLKDIASELGVSITTVARAMKDGHKIGAETVTRVRDTAERMGYVRNLDGVKLRTGRTFAAMAFLSFSNEEEIGDSGSVGLLNGIHHRFAGTDYAVRAVPVTMGDVALDRLQDVVRGRGADGIILDHTELQDPRVRYLLEAGVPFVTFGRTELLSDHAYFDIDNEHAAWQGTTALLDAGHTRIALLDGDRRYTFVRQRERGYARALGDRGLIPEPGLQVHGELAADTARAAGRVLAERGADGIVCVNELSFLGARAGVRDAIGVAAGAVGFSVRTGTNLGDYLGTPIHASHFSRVAAGWMLADLLLKRIDGASASECQIIERPCLRSPKDTA